MHTIAPALYLIPVPLGENNFPRVLPDYNRDVITHIRHFVVENIKSAKRFLAQYDKAVPIDDCAFYELSEHTDARYIAEYLSPLRNGQAVGVLSEAGCPGIADPGAAIVSLAQEYDFPVVPLIGPSSIVLALMASGFNGQKFCFNGYLPVKPRERTAKIKSLETRLYKERETQLFIETPYRNAKMIETLLAACRPETKLCIAAGITTASEYIKTKTIREWRKTDIRDLEKTPAIFLLYA